MVCSLGNVRSNCVTCPVPLGIPSTTNWNLPVQTRWAITYFVISKLLHIGICWFLSVRHMVDSFTWQNVSSPKETSSVAKKGTKQIMQDEEHSRINRGGCASHLAWFVLCLPHVLRSRTNKYLYIDVVMNLYSIKLLHTLNGIWHIYCTLVSCSKCCTPLKVCI